MGRFNISGGDLDVSDVSWGENGRMMSDSLNNNRTTSRFSFNFLIYLEKIKGTIKTCIEEWVRGRRKYNSNIRSLKS